MRSNRLRVCVAGALYYTGIVPAARWWTRRHRQDLIVLCYHRASNGDLRRHLRYLSRHYHVLPLETALEQLGRADGDRRTRLAVTFDDGYRDNYTHAYAIARELGVPITVFVIPDYVGGERCFWWREAEHLAELSPAAGAVFARASGTASVAEREAVLAAARQELAVPRVVADDRDRVLGWEEIAEMDGSGLVAFGAHTMHHPVLSRLAAPGDLRDEVERSRTVLERRLGRPVRTFAYPFGKPEHVGDGVRRAVRDAGYAWALTTLPGRNDASTDPHLLRRDIVDVSQHWLVVAADVAGVWTFLAERYHAAARALGRRP